MTQAGCTCDTCKEMCRRPCWGLPSDIVNIIKAGYGWRLMLYIYDKTWKESIELLVPAVKGGEGRSLHTEYFQNRGTSCTFQDAAGLCILHDTGLKPTEGKMACCEGPSGIGRDDIALAWEHNKGRKLVEKWKKQYMKGW